MRRRPRPARPPRRGWRARPAWGSRTRPPPPGPAGGPPSARRAAPRSRSGRLSHRRSPRRAAVRRRTSQAVGHEGVRAVAGQRLDPPHAGADAPLAGDHEAADLAGRPAVGAAAQLVAVALDPDRADRLAVLLVEERVGAGRRPPRAMVITRRADRAVLADRRVRTSSSIDGAPRRSGRGRSGKSKRRSSGVTSEPAWRARFADDVAQGPVEQVRAGVVAHRAGPAVRVDLGRSPCRRPPAGRAACRDGRSGQPAGRWVSVDLERARLAGGDRAGRPGPRPGRRPPRRTGSDRGPPRLRPSPRSAAPRRRTPRASSYSMPSRTMATTRPSAVVVS